MSYKTACYVIHIILLYCVVLILVDMRLLLLLFIKKNKTKRLKLKMHSHSPARRAQRTESNTSNLVGVFRSNRDFIFQYFL